MGLCGVRLQLVAVGAQPCELSFSVGGGILRAAGGKSFAVSREGQWMDGKEDEEVVCAQGKDDGTRVEFEADGDGFSCAPLAQGTHPCLNGFWCVLEDEVLSFCGARRV